MLKLLCCAVIICVTTALGMKKADSLGRREKNLCRINTALKIIEGEISFAQSGLKKSFERAASVSALFAAAAEEMERYSGEAALRRAVDRSSRGLCLTEEDCEAVLLLSNDLGGCDKETQIKSIRYASSVIERQISDARSEYLRSARLFRSLGVISGLLISLLLI